MSQLSIAQCTTLACLLEASAAKPGNVHRGADFDDCSFVDFAVSGVAIAPVMQRAHEGLSPGEVVLEAVHVTRSLVATNTNLGTILLLAPLAAVPRHEALLSGVSRVLQNLTSADAARVYQAIRLAMPGGLGHEAENDVAGPPPADLRLAMQQAADRDLVAKQYANGFQEVLQFAAPRLQGHLRDALPLQEAIIRTHLQLMSHFPDSLIARKCGAATAQEAADRAARVLEYADKIGRASNRPAGDQEHVTAGHQIVGRANDELSEDRYTSEELECLATADYLRELTEFDFWLRSDGHRRNPGTTADLIAATLFAGLRDGWITTPWQW